MSKINVLVIPSDKTGVGKFRSIDQHLKLQELYGNEFHIDIEYDPPYNNKEFFQNYNIIHIHKAPSNKYPEGELIINRLKKWGCKVIIDIDDLWVLDTLHPSFRQTQKMGLSKYIIANLKAADYVTTTTPIFAKEISKFNQNVFVLPNSVNPDEDQFKLTEIPKETDRVRIGWLGGSSHLYDLYLIDSVFKLPEQELDNYQFTLCGFDLRGSVYEIDKETGEQKQRDMRPDETVWYKYEKIFTNNFCNLEKYPNYITHLKKYSKNETFDDLNMPYRRIWTRPITSYAKGYQNFDISLAPLKENRFNLMKCITGDSLISTNNGILKISDIVDEKIKLKTEINGTLNNIVNYFKYENEKTLLIKTMDGYTIEGTPTHRIFSNGIWKSLKDFNNGDIIELTKPIFLTNNYQYIRYPMLLTKNNNARIEKSEEDMLPRIKINEKWGRLLGYLLGDGHLGGKSMVTVSCDKRYDDVVEDVVNLFQSIGLNPKLYEKKIDKRCNKSVVKEGFGVDIKLTSKTFIEIAKKYGLLGKNGKIFRVPDIILKSPKSVIKEFLRGLFESDGTVGKNSGVSLTSKDYELIKQIQYLLLGFGIQSKIGYTFNKKYKKKYYNLNLRRIGSDIFYRDIGFISTIKNEKLKKLFENKHSNHEFKMDFIDKIDTIEEKVNDVYDIEIDNVHSYNANGIINHNSQLKVVEAGFHKKALIAQNFGPYQIDLINAYENGKWLPEGNALLVDSKKNHKQWFKYIKLLKDNPEKINELGEKLYQTVQKYRIDNVATDRANFYKSILK